MTDSQQTKLILSSSRNKIEDSLINVAKKYFNNDNINTFKSGLLGYTMNVMSDSLSDNQVYNSFLFDERFINTAKFKSSILSNAREFSYIEGKAIPSTIFAIIGIKIEDFDVNGSVITVKPQDLDIKIGALNFSIGGNITIQQNNNKWFVQQTTNELFNCELGYLLSEVILDKENNKVLTFIAELRQIEVQYIEMVVPVRTTLVRYEIPLENKKQLCKINVYTYVNNKKEMFKEIFNDDYESTDKKKFTFSVETTNDKQFNVVLDSGEFSEFVGSGTELFIDIIETDGSLGYVEQPVFNVTTKGDILNRTFLAYSNLNSTNGLNELNVTDLKRDVIRHIQTPSNRTIITEFDYKNNISRILNVFPEDISMLMRRNDPLERTVELFSKFTNDNNEFLHSNTINIMLDKDQDILIPETLIKYDKLTETGAISSDIEYDEDEFYYKNTFTHKLVTEDTPVPLFLTFNTKFKNVVINKTEKYIEYNSKHSFLIRELFVSHFDSERIEFRARLSSDSFELLTDLYVLSNVSIFLEIKSEIDESVVLIEMKFNPDSDSPTLFEANIESNQFLSNDGCLQVKGVNFKKNKLDTMTLVDSYDNEKKAFIPNIFDLNIFIAYNDRSFAINPVTYNIGNERFYTKLGIDTSNHFLISHYKSSGLIQLIKNLTDIFKTDVVELEDNKFLIKLLPLFSAKEVENVANYKFFRDYFERLQLMKESIKLIREEPSTLAIKLFNTYGENKEFDNTDRTNIKLDIEISYNSSLSLPTILDDIRNVIIDYIKERNTVSLQTTNESRNLYLSDITTLVENNIDGIIQVRILNRDKNIYFLSDIDYKKLKPHVMRNFVPSIINVKKEDINIVVL